MIGVVLAAAVATAWLLRCAECAAGVAAIVPPRARYLVGLWRRELRVLPAEWANALWSTVRKLRWYQASEETRRIASPTGLWEAPEHRIALWLADGLNVLSNHELRRRDLLEDRVTILYYVLGDEGADGGGNHVIADRRIFQHVLQRSSEKVRAEMERIVHGWTAHQPEPDVLRQIESLARPPGSSLAAGPSQRANAERLIKARYLLWLLGAMGRDLPTTGLLAEDPAAARLFGSAQADVIARLVESGRMDEAMDLFRQTTDIQRCGCPPRRCCIAGSPVPTPLR